MMKTYLIDDSTFEIINDIKTQILTYIEHAEINESDNLQTELNTKNNLLNPEQILENGRTGAMSTGVNIYQIRIYPDGRKEEIGRIESEITAIYALMKHLQNIDENNPDKLPW